MKHRKTTGRWHDDGTFAWAQFRDADDERRRMDGLVMVGIVAGTTVALSLTVLYWWGWI